MPADHVVDVAGAVLM
jgi:hypothetical protein